MTRSHRRARAIAVAEIRDRNTPHLWRLTGLAAAALCAWHLFLPL
ncbi:hypothetical protein NOF55_16980 [Rhizobiaceae bacterium BDR2-2]|uniref:Uncharacterized protein n=1 Tax=Ectorhizobium quercum TaxID=2965071 RepID=A0AAE3N1C1_9HYPH|nr:hypothetical protein [Ectorhizobium quercum]MCX8996152.1 hypothetical protein [Ectorhizobium quercum]MCX8998809.1 hypothetical protein [Ectorhizobium quercum]